MFFKFSPRPEDFQFDYIIFFKWVGKKPPPRMGFGISILGGSSSGFVSG